jgi:UDP-3-O-[3-hydroxymyristoyl] glucosamine N-acyltransferase
MRLSDLKGVVPIEVVRDGEFESLGLLSHDADRMLVGLYDPDYMQRFLDNPHIACVITDGQLLPHVPSERGVAVCRDPLTVFYEVHEYLFRRTEFYWKDFESEVSPEARVHPRAYVAERNVRIGARSVVEPGAVILERAIIGEDVFVGAGAVIAGEGFEPKTVGGRHVIISHAGGVRIHDRVHILANATVLRAVFDGFTEVAEETKIGECATIGHHVRIGRRCEIAGGTFVSGSTTIGDDVWLGPNSTISSELRVGAGAFVTLGSVVTTDVAPGARVTGNFAIDHGRFLSFMRSIR